MLSWIMGSIARARPHPKLRNVIIDYQALQQNQGIERDPKVAIVAVARKLIHESNLHHDAEGRKKEPSVR